MLQFFVITVVLSIVGAESEPEIPMPTITLPGPQVLPPPRPAPGKDCTKDCFRTTVCRAKDCGVGGKMHKKCMKKCLKKGKRKSKGKGKKKNQN